MSGYLYVVSLETHPLLFVNDMAAIYNKHVFECYRGQDDVFVCMFVMLCCFVIVNIQQNVLECVRGLGDIVCKGHYCCDVFGFDMCRNVLRPVIDFHVFYLFPICA